MNANDTDAVRKALVEAVGVLERLPYGDWPGAMYSGKAAAANGLIRRARAALTASPAETDAGEMRDPMADPHTNWLVHQLEAWPDRVDPERTTNISYLMQEAAKQIRSQPVFARALPLTNPNGEGWLPIADAPKDGTIIWALFHPSIYPQLRPSRDDLEPWNGVQVPLRHQGIVERHDDEPFDMGWNVAAPVGQGGFPDEWIIGWRYLPSASLTTQPQAGGQG